MPDIAVDHGRCAPSRREGRRRRRPPHPARARSTSRRIGCDVYSTSSYKWYGPHAGITWIEPGPARPTARVQGPSGARHRPGAASSSARRRTRQLAAIDAAARLPASTPGSTPIAAPRTDAVRTAARRPAGRRPGHRLRPARPRRPGADAGVQRRRVDAPTTVAAALADGPDRGVGRPLLRLEAMDDARHRRRRPGWARRST